MQIVYISARPHVLSDTICQVQRFMPYVDSIVVACPDKLIKDFAQRIDAPVEYLADEQLLPEKDDLPGDHQARNFALRSALAGHTRISDTFIMSDDDFRPIRPVPISVFIEDDCYHSYYFYDLQQWPSRKTAFDRGQHVTYERLHSNHYPHLSYASHMPQIINRGYFHKCVNALAIQELPLCEWSVYFNYCHKEFPELFHPPRPYLTFCWPDAPLTWPLYIEPADHYFENYYEHLYWNHGVFAGLSSAPAPTTAEAVYQEKLKRWNSITKARSEGRVLPCDPWVKKSHLRRFLLTLLRPISYLLSLLGINMWKLRRRAIWQ